MKAKLFRRTEFYLALMIVLVCLVFGGINGSFYSASHILDLLRACIVKGIFAMGCLLVIISGGMDVSFPAIAAFSYYLTVKIFTSGSEPTGSLLSMIMLSALFGAILGMINGWLGATLKIPPLIITLGTSSIFGGVLLNFIGSTEIMIVPDYVLEFSRTNLITIKQGNVTTGLNVGFLFLIAVVVLVALLLRYTMLGRGIYTVGGNPDAAKRVGLPVKPILMFVYTAAGMCAGLAGIVYNMMFKWIQPKDLTTQGPMMVIAAVVLGGANITGGKGTVLGTVLGLLLITIVNNSMILVGIPSVAQTFFVGVAVLVGVGVSSYQNLRASRRVHEVEADENQG